MDKFSGSRTRITNPDIIQKYLPAFQPAVFIYRNADDSLKPFRSVLHHKNGQLYFEYDIIKNEIDLKKGDELFVRVFSPGAQYNEFRIIIESYHPEQNIMLCLMPEEIIRVQRRKAYRVIISLDIAILQGVLTESASEGGMIWETYPMHGQYKDTLYLETRMLDLSLGGMLILSTRPFEVNKNITVVFPVCDEKDNQLFIELGARACRNREITTKKGEKIYHTGFEFIKMSNQINQLISRYVTRLQINYKRDNEVK